MDGFPNMDNAKKSFDPFAETASASSQTETGSSQELPVIRVTPGEIATTASFAEVAIMRANLPVYQYGRKLMRPAIQEVAASKGRRTMSACLAELTRAGAIDVMAQSATWERFDGRTKDYVPIDPPGPVADIMLARFGEWRFPRITGVITTPTLRQDLSILDKPGYDAQTGLYLIRDEQLVMPTIPENQTRDDALAALSLLEDLLINFPFVSDVDRSVALSGLITPVCRGAIAVVPLHAYRAHTPGTGKSYLGDLASTIVSGRPCPVTSAGRNADETDKRLVGLLLSGFPIISIDNVNGELGSDLLCQATERPLLRLRALGKSEIFEVATNSTLIANGNGFAVVEDMTRRTLVADLDAEMERPELRKFSFDPVERVLQDRGRYVAACLTIVRAFVLSAAKPDMPPLASYSDYSATVRGALVWLGRADPAQSMERAREDDPEMGQLRAVMGQWISLIGLNNDITSKALIQRADLHERDEETGRQLPTFVHPELRDALITVAPGRQGIDSAKFGRWMNAKMKRIVTMPIGQTKTARVRFECPGKTDGSSRWRLAVVAERG